MCAPLAPLPHGSAPSPSTTEYSWAALWLLAGFRIEVFKGFALLKSFFCFKIMFGEAGEIWNGPRKELQRERNRQFTLPKSCETHAHKNTQSYAKQTKVKGQEAELLYLKFKNIFKTWMIEIGLKADFYFFFFFKYSDYY